METKNELVDMARIKKEEWLFMRIGYERWQSEQQALGYLSQLVYALELITMYELFPEHVEEINAHHVYYCGRVCIVL